MIENFEEITHELTEDELKILEPLIDGLILRGPENPAKAAEIIDGLNKYIIVHNIKSDLTGKIIKMRGARLRKMINHIRSNSLYPIIATSKGYFMSVDPEIIASQIRSLKQRSRSIDDCAAGLELFLNKKSKS